LRETGLSCKPQIGGGGKQRGFLALRYAIVGLLQLAAAGFLCVLRNCLAVALRGSRITCSLKMIL